MNAHLRPFLLIGLLFPIVLFAQSLHSDSNRPRTGDRLMKRQITACDPGEAGTAKLWDFSALELPEAGY